jgi:hypothetical protein
LHTATTRKAYLALNEWYVFFEASTLSIACLASKPDVW